MPEYSDKELSMLINSTLDNFGYKKENVLLRSNWVNDQQKKADRIFKPPFTQIPAGSAAEGVQLTSSDWDVMQVLHDVVCVDKGSVESCFVVLETDYTNTAPGYTKVVSVSVPDNLAVSGVVKFLCYKEGRFGKIYISSGRVKGLYNYMYLAASLETNYSTNGPAMTVTGEFPLFCDTDVVMSVRFYGGKFLERWAKRCRLYSWPPIEIVKEVSEMEGYIVPVGDKQSENPNLEWRICYTTAEKHLISNLSDTQLKLYVILKMVSKDIFKPICKELTSYVIKNVIFWITERSNQHQFSVEHLVNALQNSLNFIKHCIQNNHLPNYMIPERNLLKGAVYGQEKVKIIKFLSQCLEEGGTIILRIPKLYTCISLRVTDPENVFKFGIWRDSVEKGVLLFTGHVLGNFIAERGKRSIQNITPVEIISNCIPRKSEPRWAFQDKISLMSLVLPDNYSLLFSGMSVESIRKIYNGRLHLLEML